MNIPKNENSFIVEIDLKYRSDEQVIFSKTIKNDSLGKPFRIHEPKNATQESLLAIKDHITNFESFLKKIIPQRSNNLDNWINMEELIKYYWIEEISKNPDAKGGTSIFFSWQQGKPIQMGPVWDFDLSFGGYNNVSVNTPQDWRIKKGYWHTYIFKDSIADQQRINFWKTNKDKFTNIIDAIDSISTILQDAARNNFKKWDILQSTKYIYHRHAYNTYEDAVEDLKRWINERILWIDKEISPP